jgi:hypothetical protein
LRTICNNDALVKQDIVIKRLFNSVPRDRRAWPPVAIQSPTKGDDPITRGQQGPPVGQRQPEHDHRPVPKESCVSRSGRSTSPRMRDDAAVKGGTHRAVLTPG